jgi:hypothetical protein
MLCAYMCVNNLSARMREWVGGCMDEFDATPRPTPAKS